MTHVIFTASDAHYGDFLLKHWLRSVLQHVNLQQHGIDIVILDYGLSAAQLRQLTRPGVSMVQCMRDGHVMNLRYRDMLRCLEARTYDQVMTVDSGDLIVQADIGVLFTQHCEAYRAACEDVPSPFGSRAARRWFATYQLQDLAEPLQGKRMINGGLLLAPAEKFKHLCRTAVRLIRYPDKGALDQIVINHVLHQEGFIPLDNKYNFVLATAARKFIINHGRFYLENGEVIPVVHNAGGQTLFRVVRNFGYAEGYNKVRWCSLFRLKRLLA